MKVISVIYMSRRNFWCMTRGDSSHLNFQLQKVDWEPSGRQNQGKMMEFWKILYIHFIRDLKGITYLGFFLQIESDAKMRWSTVQISWHKNLKQSYWGHLLHHKIIGSYFYSISMFEYFLSLFKYFQRSEVVVYMVQEVQGQLWRTRIKG